MKSSNFCFYSVLIFLSCTLPLSSACHMSTDPFGTENLDSDEDMSIGEAIYSYDASKILSAYVHIITKPQTITSTHHFAKVDETDESKTLFYVVQYQPPARNEYVLNLLFMYALRDLFQWYQKIVSSIDSGSLVLHDIRENIIGLNKLIQNNFDCFFDRSFYIVVMDTIAQHVMHSIGQDALPAEISQMLHAIKIAHERITSHQLSTPDNNDECDQEVAQACTGALASKRALVDAHKKISNLGPLRTNTINELGLLETFGGGRIGRILKAIEREFIFFARPKIVRNYLNTLEDDHAFALRTMNSEIALMEDYRWADPVNYLASRKAMDNLCKATKKLAHSKQHNEQMVQELTTKAFLFRGQKRKSPTNATCHGRRKRMRTNQQYPECVNGLQ